jgi:integrase
MADAPILVRKVRVLGPYEVDQLIRAIPKDTHKTIFEICLWTGMRYVEIQRLYDHPEWWQPTRRAIFLPEESQKKVKRKQVQRYVHPVPHAIESELRRFFKGPRPPGIHSWNRDLKRWAVEAGLNPIGISAKTTRKSIESWLITAGVQLNIVCLRQGHDSLTSMLHYQGLPFTEAEKIEIRRRLAGWT